MENRQNQQMMCCIRCAKDAQDKHHENAQDKNTELDVQNEQDEKMCKMGKKVKSFSNSKPGVPVAFCNSGLVVHRTNVRIYNTMYTLTAQFLHH